MVETGAASGTSSQYGAGGQVDGGSYPGPVLAAEAPKVTDWMQAWGSVLSLVMSTVAVIFTGWLLRHEIKVRRVERVDTEAAQARLVVGSVSDCRGQYPGQGVTGPVTEADWQVKNYSGAPIFDLRVQIESGIDDRRGQVIESEATGTVKCDPPLTVDQGMMFDPREVLMKIEFTDAAGLRWTRLVGDPPKRYMPSYGAMRRQMLLASANSGLPRWLPRRLRAWHVRRLVQSRFEDKPPF